MDAELSFPLSKLSQQNQKRLLDILGALLLLLLLAPVFGVVLLLVWIESPGAAFFCQERVGLGGKRFTLFKFRTMRQDTAEALVRYFKDNEQSRIDFEKYQKLSRDPRFTRMGRFLRRTSLDELPQLWNVLLGDMSLVGPRPFLPEQLRLYGPAYRYYQLARPGLTGLWQISGRNCLSFQERVWLDQQYIQSWSLWLDLQIALRTPATILSQKGAY